MTVFLSNSVILILSLLAVIFAVSAKFVTNKYVSAVLSVIGFLLVLSNITYALLLGAELTEVLIYVLAFSLIGVITLLPDVKQGFDNVNNIVNSSDKKDNNDIKSSEDLDSVEEGEGADKK